jgi:hypothetical protein
MVAVLDAPVTTDHEVDTITEAYALCDIPPQRRPARAGFWRTLLQYMRRYPAPLTPSSYRSVHTCEAPIDLLARQYPTLNIQAYARI